MSGHPPHSRPEAGEDDLTDVAVLTASKRRIKGPIEDSSYFCRLAAVATFFICPRKVPP